MNGTNGKLGPSELLPAWGTVRDRIYRFYFEADTGPEPEDFFDVIETICPHRSWLTVMGWIAQTETPTRSEQTAIWNWAKRSVPHVERQSHTQPKLFGNIKRPYGRFA